MCLWLWGCVVSNRLAQVVAAKSRLTRLEPDDIRIIEPLLDDMAQQLALTGEVEFRIDGGSCYVDGLRFECLKGFRHLNKILAKPQRGVSESTLTSTGESLSRDNLLDRKAMQQLHDRKLDLIYECKELRWTKRTYRGTGWVDERLEMLHKEIAELALDYNKTTHGGKSQSFADSFDLARVAVKKAIDRAIDRLYTHPSDWSLDVGPRRLHPQTAHIGAHLQRYIETGSHCRYFGKWKWKT